MHIYVHIAITYCRGRFNHDPEVHYFKAIGEDKPESRWDLDVDTANIMMWELVKRGGKNIFKSNPYNPHICTREVTLSYRE